MRLFLHRPMEDSLSRPRPETYQEDNPYTPTPADSWRIFLTQARKTYTRRTYGPGCSLWQGFAVGTCRVYKSCSPKPRPLEFPRKHLLRLFLQGMSCKIQLRTPRTAQYYNLSKQWLQALHACRARMYCNCPHYLRLLGIGRLDMPRNNLFLCPGLHQMYPMGMLPRSCHMRR